MNHKKGKFVVNSASKTRIIIIGRYSHHSVLGCSQRSLRTPTILSFHWLFPPASFSFGPEALAFLCKMSAHLSSPLVHPSPAQVLFCFLTSAVFSVDSGTICDLSEPKTKFRDQILSRGFLQVSTLHFDDGNWVVCGCCCCFIFNSKILASGISLCKVTDMSIEAWQSTASKIIFCIALFTDDSGLQSSQD